MSVSQRKWPLGGVQHETSQPYGFTTFLLNPVFVLTGWALSSSKEPLSNHESEPIELCSKFSGLKVWVLRCRVGGQHWIRNESNFCVVISCMSGIKLIQILSIVRQYQPPR